jgi:hypothetical protein
MKEKALHVLLLEDNAGNSRLLREMLRTEKPESFELTHLFWVREDDPTGRQAGGRASGEAGKKADYSLYIREL